MLALLIELLRSHHSRRAAHLLGTTEISRTFAVAELDVDASDGALDALDASRSLMPRQRVTSAANRKAQLTLAFDTATKRVLPCKEDSPAFAVGFLRPSASDGNDISNRSSSIRGSPQYE